MSRVEHIGRATLHLGDCREIMRQLEPVDHILSDPPYEDELHGAIGRIRRNDGREMIDDLGFTGINQIRNEISQICVEKSSGWLILFTLAEGVRAWRDDIQAAGGKYDTCLAWIKPDAAPRFNGQGAARGFECAVTAWCGTGYRSWNGGGKLLEVKAAKGVLTDSQKELHPVLESIGWPVSIVRNETEAYNALVDAGAPVVGVLS